MLLPGCKRGFFSVVFPLGAATRRPPMAPYGGARLPTLGVLCLVALQLLALLHLHSDLGGRITHLTAHAQTVADAAVSRLRGNFETLAQGHRDLADRLAAAQVLSSRLPSADRRNNSPAMPAPTAEQPYRVNIFVFTYNRLTGVQRLMRSLQAADYLGHRVDLTLFIDHPSKAPDKEPGTIAADDPEAGPILQWVRKDLVWAYGDLRVHRRERNAGLKRSIMEAWYPMDDSHLGAFFEDDTEVSPLWYVWVDAAVRRYYLTPDRPPRLIGLSLYRPMHDELNGRGLPLEGGGRPGPFLFQSPCSWGAVYFPAPWRAFRDWFGTVDFDPKLPWPTPSNQWFRWDSWKKFLLRLMWDRGLYMVYLDLPDRAVLSTNHLMQGTHRLPPRAKYELPLLTREQHAALLTALGRDPLACPPLAALTLYDMRLRTCAAPADLPGASAPWHLTL